jgi:predicted transcriptional regulator
MAGFQMSTEVAFSTDSHCYVVVLDKAGRVDWIGRGPFTEKAYAGLQREVMGLIRTGKHGDELHQ